MSSARRTQGRFPRPASRDSITGETHGNTAMTTMTSKGQVTIPKRMREALGLKPGNEVVFELRPPGEAVIRRAGKPPKSRFAKLRGSLKGGPSTDEIMALLRGED